MTGLKSKLNNWIRDEQGKMIPIDVIERQVKLWNFKISNYERRLRESPEIGKVFKNGAIIGYYWKPTQEMRLQASQTTQPVSDKVKQFLQTDWSKTKCINQPTPQPNKLF